MARRQARAGNPGSHLADSSKHGYRIVQPWRRNQRRKHPENAGSGPVSGFWLLRRFRKTVQNTCENAEKQNGPRTQNFEFRRPGGAPGQCPGGVPGRPGGPPGQLSRDCPGGAPGHLSQEGPGTPRDAPGQPVPGGPRDNLSRVTGTSRSRQHPDPFQSHMALSGPLRWVRDWAGARGL